MRLPFCPYEGKVAELLSKNMWPWSADPDLLDHSEKCSRCSDVVLAAQMIKQERSAVTLTAHTDSPYYLWWRAQLRRRNSTVEQITKPLACAEKLAVICMFCIAGCLVFWQWRQIGRWFGWLAGNIDDKAFWNTIWLHSAVESNLIGYSILAGIAAIVCVCGLTLFMSGGKDSPP